MIKFTFYQDKFFLHIHWISSASVEVYLYLAVLRKVTGSKRKCSKMVSQRPRIKFSNLFQDPTLRTQLFFLIFWYAILQKKKIKNVWFADHIEEIKISSTPYPKVKIICCQNTTWPMNLLDSSAFLAVNFAEISDHLQTLWWLWIRWYSGHPLIRRFLPSALILGQGCWSIIEQDTEPSALMLCHQCMVNGQSFWRAVGTLQGSHCCQSLNEWIQNM